MGLSGLSLGLGLTVDLYTYALAVNSVPLFVPLVLYEGVTRMRNGALILKVHSITMYLYLLLVLAADVALVAYLSVVYAYCSRHNKECSSSNAQCSSSVPGFATKVTCASQSTEVIDLLSVLWNILTMFSLAAYLVFTHKLRTLLLQAAVPARPNEDLPESTVISVLGIKLPLQAADPDAELVFPMSEKNNATIQDIQPNVTIC